MTNIELAVLEFIKANPKVYTGPTLCNGMKFGIEMATINLINRGYINVGFDWTLTATTKKDEDNESKMHNVQNHQ